MTTNTVKPNKIKCRIPNHAKNGVLELINKRPKNCQAPALKSFDGTASPRLAIKAMCQQCLGYEDVVSGAKSCKSYVCPLWNYRPYQDKGDGNP